MDRLTGTDWEMWQRVWGEVLISLDIPKRIRDRVRNTEANKMFNFGFTGFAVKQSVSPHDPVTYSGRILVALDISDIRQMPGELTFWYATVPCDLESLASPYALGDHLPVPGTQLTVGHLLDEEFIRREFEVAGRALVRMLDNAY